MKEKETRIKNLRKEIKKKWAKFSSKIKFLKNQKKQKEWKRKRKKKNLKWMSEWKKICCHCQSNSMSVTWFDNRKY